MDRAYRIEAWNHTTQILAMLHNVHVTDERNVKHPWQYHPYPDEVKPEMPVVGVGALKSWIPRKR